MGRVVTALLYLIVIFLIALLLIPERREESLFRANRYLGSNTRLARVLWTEPAGQTWLSRIGSDRLDRELDGKYLRRAIDAGAPFGSADVMPTPNLSGEDVVQVPLESEPDWLMLNQGTTVEVWFGQKLATPHGSVIEAIVATAKDKWTALLPRKDFAAEALKGPMEKPSLRLVRLPDKPAPSPPRSTCPNRRR